MSPGIQNPTYVTICCKKFNLFQVYKITGLDLTGVNPNTLDFVYIDASGNMYTVEYDYVTMDAATGMLKVVNAVLPHFSRYGFVN